jgi:hypothetical protein
VDDATLDLTRHLPGGLTIMGEKTGEFRLNFWNSINFNLDLRMQKP